MTQVRIVVRLSSPMGEAHQPIQSFVTSLDSGSARAASQFWHERQALKSIAQLHFPRLIVEEVVGVDEL